MPTLDIEGWTRHTLIHPRTTGARPEIVWALLWRCHRCHHITPLPAHHAAQCPRTSSTSEKAAVLRCASCAGIGSNTARGEDPCSTCLGTGWLRSLTRDESAARRHPRFAIALAKLRRTGHARVQQYRGGARG